MYINYPSLFFFGEDETEAHYIKPSCQPQIYTDEHISVDLWLNSYEFYIK